MAASASAPSPTLVPSRSLTCAAHAQSAPALPYHTPKLIPPGRARAALRRRGGERREPPVPPRDQHFVPASVLGEQGRGARQHGGRRARAREGPQPPAEQLEAAGRAAQVRAPGRRPVLRRAIACARPGPRDQPR